MFYMCGSHPLSKFVVGRVPSSCCHSYQMTCKPWILKQQSGSILSELRFDNRDDNGGSEWEEGREVIHGWYFCCSSRSGVGGVY